MIHTSHTRYRLGERGYNASITIIVSAGGTNPEYTYLNEPDRSAVSYINLVT